MAQGVSLTPGERGASDTERALRSWQTVNMHPVDSLLSLLGGGALLTFALRKRGGLGVASALLGGELLRRGLTRHCFLYQGLHIATVGQTLEEAGYCRSEREVTINRSPQELYQYWHNFEQLPTILPILKDVHMEGAEHSHWAIYAPGGFALTWEAEITSEKPGESISWRTLPGSKVAQRGSIEFVPAPGGRGTELRVVLEYAPPGGKIGDTLAKALHMSPDQKLRESLRQFKAIMETGEIPRA